MLPEFKWGDTVIALCQLPSGRMFQIQIDIFSYRPVRCGYFLQGTQGCFEYDRAAVVSGGKLSDWKSVDQLEKEYLLTDGENRAPFVLLMNLPPEVPTLGMRIDDNLIELRGVKPRLSRCYLYPFLIWINDPIGDYYVCLVHIFPFFRGFFINEKLR